MTGPHTVRLATVPYGDSAVLVRPIDGAAERRWRTVHELADLIETHRGVENVVATYDCLLVEFDCALVTHSEIESALRAPAATAATVRPSRLYDIPVVYGGEHGPDLDEVAAELDLTTDALVELHTGTEWVIRFRGAPAGAPMLDGSPFARPVRRRSRPRLSVPAGSVALAGEHGVIYPVRSPGGWRLIGRTPLRLVDVRRQPPVAYWPGDRIRFTPLAADRWEELSA